MFLVVLRLDVEGCISRFFQCVFSLYSINKSQFHKIPHIIMTKKEEIIGDRVDQYQPKYQNDIRRSSRFETAVSRIKHKQSASLKCNTFAYGPNLILLSHLNLTLSHIMKCCKKVEAILRLVLLSSGVKIIFYKIKVLWFSCTQIDKYF